MRRAARNLLVAATAAASLALTAFAWRESREQARKEEGLRLDLRVQEIAGALRGRMLDYEQVLRGAGALFNASRRVQREEWTAYVAALDLQSSFPGVRVLSYAEVQGARAPVTYIAPPDAENLRAIGFDLNTDPLRRAAMELARDAAEPVLTAPVQLLRDAREAPRPAFVLFLPVFRGSAPATLEARRAQIAGFVYGSFRVRDLVERSIGDPTGLRIRLLDLTDAAAPAVLFEPDNSPSARPLLERAEVIVVRGRTWRLEATALPGGGFDAVTERPRLVLTGGVAISLLLTMLVWSLINTASHARDLARRMVAANEELDRFRTATDAHQDTMLMVNGQTMRIVYANEGACRNLGYQRRELIGQHPEIVFADRDAATLKSEYERLSAGGDATLYRAMQKRKDGSLVPVEVSRQLVRTAGGDYIIGVARDISQRLEAERALRESEQRLALAVQSSGLALFDWDLKSGRIHMGGEWNAILGDTGVASVTTLEALESLAHPDDLPALREQLRLLLKGEITSYRVEHRVRKRSGEWTWIESIAEVSERDASGRALRITGTNADITQRKALVDMKAAFLAAVSHELRTPLTGIVASLELLKEGAAGQLPEQARRFIDGAHANGERLAELIGDVLDLERAESGRLRLQLERLDAAQELRDAAALNAPYAERYKARLRMEAAPGLNLTADRKRLQQVIANLVSNAAKFSPEGGEIRLAARAAGDSRVLLSVSDQGPGVPHDFRQRMFEKFEQAEHGKGGTGLGLAICKALVERMGGRIWYEASGRGATFLVELPGA